MKYDLLVTAIPNDRAKTLVARQLANDPSIPLHKALAMMDDLPVVLNRNIDLDDLKVRMEKLERFGVYCKAVEAQKAVPIKHSTPFPTKQQPESKMVPPKELPAKKTAVSYHPFGVFKTAPAPKPPQLTHRKKLAKTLFTISSICVLIIFIAGLSLLRKKRTFRIQKGDSVLVKENGSDQINPSTPVKSARNEIDNSRKTISTKQKTESSILVDSAQSCGTDFQRAINFYKIAISFNKYNVHAWYGLINAYRSVGMTEEMNDAQTQMLQIFGKDITTVSKIVKPFGPLNDIWLTPDGIYRIEYRTSMSNQKDMVLETYTIAKALRPTCDCKAISLFASTGPGTGLMAYVDSSAPLISLSSFKENASLTFLD